MGKEVEDAQLDSAVEGVVGAAVVEVDEALVVAEVKAESSGGFDVAQACGRADVNGLEEGLDVGLGFVDFSFGAC